MYEWRTCVSLVGHVDDMVIYVYEDSTPRKLVGSVLQQPDAQNIAIAIAFGIPLRVRDAVDQFCHSEEHSFYLPHQYQFRLKNRLSPCGDPRHE